MFPEHFIYLLGCVTLLSPEGTMVDDSNSDVLVSSYVKEIDRVPATTRNIRGALWFLWRQLELQIAVKRLIF